MSQLVTTDTPLATYLIICGFEPEITIANRKVQFIFNNSSNNIQSHIDKFNSGLAVGNIPQYHETYQRLIKHIRDLKKRSI